MSLPARPNRPGAGGLPGAPRARPSAPRDRPAEGSSRTVRPQRSLNQLPSRPRPSGDEYDALPAAPRTRTRSTAGRDERGSSRDRERARPPLPSQRDSDSSGSSAASFLDRMRVRSSDTTPRTSVDDDDRKPARSSSRRRDDDDEDDALPRRDYRKSVVAQAAAEGDGSWLWKSVASAAGSLTLNINKAWTTKVAQYSGEETPPGEESRLTRAMKAYHLEKAQKPADLPDWLFPASARKAPRTADDQGRERDRSRSRADYEEEPPAPRGRGLRDIYDSAAREGTRPAPAPARSYAATEASDAPAPSKAVNRLKALRDAKRAAAGVRGPSPEPVGEVAREAPAPSAPVARARVGLPTGPGRPRRPA